MRGTLPALRRAASELDGQVLAPPPRLSGSKQSTDKTVRPELQPISFRDLARFAWPQKTELFLSHITGYDARTCRRWLAGHTEPPAEALGIIFHEILRRFTQRP